MKKEICRGRRPRRPAKRIISLILSLIMLSSVTAGLDFSAYADGSLGDNVRWSFDASTGTLTISGSGEMKNYTNTTMPFRYDTKIKKAIISDGIYNIGNYVFYTCYSLTSVTIPNSVSRIGDYAFCACKELSDIIIPNRVTDIGEYAFQGSGLSSITLPNSITKIDIGTFKGCRGLTSITIPNSVTNIGVRAFEGCLGLTSITIPNSITSISNYTFYDCSGLTNVTIPNSVTSIGSSAFENCSGLKSITIPDSVTNINQCVFLNCSELTSIVLPNRLSTISSAIFSGCSNLTSVTIPESVTSIIQYAFNNCYSLNQIYYKGSETEWKGIYIESGNDYLKSASISYSKCVTGYNHIYDSGTITTQPTCTKTGVKKYKCTNCSSSYTEVVPALGHNYVEKVTKAATCTKSGTSSYTCSRCNNSYTATVNALGHNYKTTIKKATPKEDGYSDSVCTRCGDEHYKSIESPEVSITQYVYDYDGKTKKPEVLVYKNGEYNSYLSKENYSIVYPKESKKLGTYTIKIVLKGAYYSGTFEESFKIQPKSVNPKKIKTKPYSKEQISVSWKKVKGVDGYIVYRWSNKKGKYVKYKKTKKTSIKIKRENKKTNQVDFVIATYKKQGKKNYEGYWIGKTEWVKLSAPTFKIEQNEIKEFTMVFPYEDFYYIQWSNNANFSVDDKNTSKNYWVKTGMYADKNNDPAKKVSRIRVFGLKANQTVYVRARKVYYNKKGKLVLGPWSKAKKVITY